MAKMADKYGSLWDRDELILALYLYCQIPFGRCTQRSQEVIDLAKLIGRTPASIARRLGNFGAFDSKLKERGVTGLSHGGKKVEGIWNEFCGNWDALVGEAERLLNEYDKPEAVVTEYLKIPERDQTEKEVSTKQRLGQDFFRRAVLSSYENRCCITGLRMPELLTASHIVPWSEDQKNRLNPSNGLCLNSLHDRAFDRGLISVSDNYQVLVSTRVREFETNDTVRAAFLAFEGKSIQLPSRFMPGADFLFKHREKWGFV